jgi:PAS domain S-box-containing protein
MVKALANASPPEPASVREAAPKGVSVSDMIPSLADAVLSGVVDQMQVSSPLPDVLPMSPASALLPELAEQMLTRLYAPPSVVVSEKGNVRSMHGRSAAHIVAISTTSYNKPVFALVAEELRTTLLETFQIAVKERTSVTSTPRCVTSGGEPEFITMTVRPLSGGESSIKHTHSGNGTSAQELSTTRSESRHYLITFDSTFDEAALRRRRQANEHGLAEALSEALQRAEQRYNELLHAVTDYVFTVTVEHGNVTHTQHGPNCVAVTGYTSHEYYAQPTLWIDMVHPDDRDTVRDHASRILTDKAAEPLEHRIIHKDGSVRWVRNTPVLHFSEQGELTGYDGLVYNITDRKTAEELLRENEERFRFILEQSPLGVALTNPQGRIVQANDVFCEMLGYTEQELRGMTIDEVTHPNDRDREKELTAPLMEGSEQIIRIEKRYMTKAGEELWVNLHSSLIHDGRGSPVFSLGLAENITARKQAETALRTSEARLNALMQNANDAVSITDENAVFTYLSPSTARLFYFGPQMLVGKSFFDYIHPDDRSFAQAAYKHLVEMPPNAMKSYRYRFRRADGTWALVESVATNLLKHPLIQGIVTNTRDISGRDTAHDDDEHSDHE